MLTKIKAIETKYHGYSMRSRLEARYAILFDAMGFQWEYEHEGFRLKSGQYLPDFWLPDVKMWAEVKGNSFTTPEHQLAQELSAMTQYPVLMLVGTPDYKPYAACMPDGGQEIDFYLFNNHGQLFASYGGDDMGSQLLHDAVAASRAARFEHGEKP